MTVKLKYLIIPPVKAEISIYHPVLPHTINKQTEKVLQDALTRHCMPPVLPSSAEHIHHRW